MSQVSCRDFLVVDPLVDCVLQSVKLPAQGGVVLCLLGDYLGQAWSQDAVVCPGTKQSDAPAAVRDPVTMPLGDAFDEPMQTQPPQVIGHLSRGQCFRRFPQQGRPVVTQFAVGK